MSNPNLTPWFPGSVRPARPGVYLASVLMNTDLDDSRGLYRYWNGKHWCKPAETPDGALEPTLLRRAFFRITYWRGRANPPRADGVPEVAAPSITDEELSRRFTRCAYPGPNPMYRCNGCGAEEYGVRNLLVEHARTCGVEGRKP